MKIPEEYEWVKDGVPVWYRPSLSSDTKHAARVNGTPWAIGGSDTWVVHLDGPYRNGQGTVKAAYLGALEPRQETETRRPPVSFERGQHTFWLHTLGSNGHPYPTQQETTDEDLVAAILALPEARREKVLRSIDPDHTEVANRACGVLVRKLDLLLDSGRHSGTFASGELEKLAQRLLALRAYPNLSWEMLVSQFEKILDTGEHGEPFASVSCERLAQRLLELRGAGPSPAAVRAEVQRLENLGDYSIFDERLEHVVHLFDCLLSTGTNPGILSGGEKTQAFAARLQELHAHPDPGFGCDPSDSASLCELRQACDDHLVWPSNAQRESGDYLAAVVHSAMLARFALNLAMQVSHLTEKALRAEASGESGFIPGDRL